MERWQDQALVLSARGHSDHGIILTIISAEHGKHLGYVSGGMSSKKRGQFELGNLINVEWQARTHDQMGQFSIEPEHNFSNTILDDYQRLMALQSACALLDMTLAEREVHSELYQGTLVLFEMLKTEVWAESYIMWELALLKELGFGLDLSRCAAGGDPQNLIYVSPKSAIAVSKEQGETYKDKLLPLPQFLIGKDDVDQHRSVIDGLALCGYFFEHRVLAHTNLQTLPEIRGRLVQSLTG